MIRNTIRFMPLNDMKYDSEFQKILEGSLAPIL